MRTVIVNIPEKDRTVFNAILKRFGYQSRTISNSEKEEIAIARWIEEGMKSEEVSRAAVKREFQKNGINF